MHGAGAQRTVHRVDADAPLLTLAPPLRHGDGKASAVGTTWHDEHGCVDCTMDRAERQNHGRVAHPVVIVVVSLGSARALVELSREVVGLVAKVLEARIVVVRKRGSSLRA